MKNEKIEILKGINLRFIPEEKFKTTGIAISFFMPINTEYASKNAVLSKLLSRSCKKYPSFEILNKRLEELYGAEINSSVTKIGEMQAVTVGGSCIKDKFAIDNDSVVSDVMEIIYEMIFNPDLDGEAFKQENLNAEKRELIEAIKAVYNDKKRYAYRQCEKHMCKDEKFGISKYGEIEDVKKLTGKDIFEAWQNLLKTARVEIVLLGGVAFEPICAKFKEKFLDIQREFTENFETEIIKKTKKIKEIEESAEVTQSKMVMGFRTGISENDSAFEVNCMTLTIAILGGTARSKLFLNVREKLSLCYYCAAAYNKHKGLMFIQSGVEKINIQKAKDEILKQIESLKIGDFNDEELTENKLILKQSIQKINDSVSGLAEFYVSQIFSKEKQTPEEILKNLEQITRDNIMKCAEKLSLDTIYNLVSETTES